MLQLTIIGNLGADAQVKEANGKKFVSFNVAHSEKWVDRDGVIHDNTQWVGCALPGDGGNLLPYLKTGTTVMVSGNLKTRVYPSEKARGYVAGLDIAVKQLELVGGKTDAVPAKLQNSQGETVNVTKCFWSPIKSTTMYGQGGRIFYADANGFIQPSNQSYQAPTQEQQPDFNETEDPLVSQMRNADNKRRQQKK